MSSNDTNDAFVYFELPDSAKAAFTADNRAKYGDNEPPHVTVVYLPGLSDEELLMATRAIELLEKAVYPIEIEFGNLSLFSLDESSVAWYVEITSDRLHRFREAVCNLFERLQIHVSDSYANYIPHATLAYGSEGDIYIGEVPTGKVCLNRLRISSRKSQLE